MLARSLEISTDGVRKTPFGIHTTASMIATFICAAYSARAASNTTSRFRPFR
jgi:hypothetical protein